LLSPVNPKTNAENAIISGSVPYYGWTMARTARGPFAKNEMLVEEERADIDFRFGGTNRTNRARCMMSVDWVDRKWLGYRRNDTMTDEQRCCGEGPLYRTSAYCFPRMGWWTVDEEMVATTVNYGPEIRIAA
jgi:hypothetical protein